MGSRQLPWWAVLASIVAAELSAATFLGTPGEGYHLRNFTYAQLAIGTVIARIIVAYLFIRPFFDNNVVSIYEFLQLRFGVVTRKRGFGGVFGDAAAGERNAAVRGGGGGGAGIRDGARGGRRRRRRWC